MYITRARKLFKGGNYSREETICRNTVISHFYILHAKNKKDLADFWHRKIIFKSELCYIWPSIPNRSKYLEPFYGRFHRPLALLTHHLTQLRSAVQVWSLYLHFCTHTLIVWKSRLVSNSIPPWHEFQLKLDRHFFFLFWSR